jgi:hypothetical protein
MFRRIIAYFRIPKGDYCYTPIGWKNGVYKIKPCPYWDKNTSMPHQLSGYCHYLKCGDFDIQKLKCSLRYGNGI